MSWTYFGTSVWATIEVEWNGCRWTSSRWRNQKQWLARPPKLDWTMLENTRLSSREELCARKPRYSCVLTAAVHAASSLAYGSGGRWGGNRRLRRIRHPRSARPDRCRTETTITGRAWFYERWQQQHGAGRPIASPFLRLIHATARVTLLVPQHETKKSPGI